VKRLTISRNSWHYKLALYGLLNEDRDETDLCRYWWALVRGVLRAPFLALAGAVVVYAVLIDPLLMLAVYAATGVLVSPDALPMTLALYGVGTVIAVSAYRDWVRKSRPRREPGLVATAYHGWKEKTCVLVRVE
jgi:hypothetical protein